MGNNIDELCIKILNIAEYVYSHELYNNTLEIANPIIRDQQQTILQSKIDAIHDIRTLLMVCTDNDISRFINTNNLNVEYLRKYFIRA